MRPEVMAKLYAKNQYTYVPLRAQNASKGKNDLFNSSEIQKGSGEFVSHQQTGN